MFGLMHLLIIRHAIAEDREESAKTGKPDDLRPLTADGRAKMIHCAQGLREIAPEISVLASSPLVRAHDTAAIVADEYGIEIRSTTEALVPGAPLSAFVDWIGDRADQPVVAVVGHEPHLSTLATWLISGVEESHLELKKGGALLISFKGPPKKAAGTLEWALHPSHLRTIAKAR
jgi:phosphohistidine phosphatase